MGKGLQRLTELGISTEKDRDFLEHKKPWKEALREDLKKEKEQTKKNLSKLNESDFDHLQYLQRFNLLNYNREPYILNQ